LSSEQDNRDFVVAVDIGGTKILACLVDGNNRMVDEHRFLTGTHRGPRAIVENTVAVVRDMVEKNEVPRSRLLGVGVASAGPCDSVEGAVINGPNLGWQNVPVARWMADALDVPVCLGNDANLAALGEQRYGAGTGVENMVYVTVSTGIGGGIITDGHLHSGGSGLSGEIGHITVQAGGPLCTCGRRGCLQSLCAGPALARNVQERLAQGGSSLSMFQPLQLLELAKSRPEEITPHLVFEAAGRGDALSLAVLREGARNLGIGLTTLAILLDPEMIVVGGGLAVRWDQYIAHAVDFVKANTYPRSMQDISIVPASLGDRAGIVGAAAFARDRFGRDAA
jgi:glucokinase